MACRYSLPRRKMHRPTAAVHDRWSTLAVGIKESRLGVAEQAAGSPKKGHCCRLTVVRPTPDPWKLIAVMAWTAYRWSMLMKFSGSWRRWGLPSFCPDQIFRLEIAGNGSRGWLMEKMEHRISVLRWCTDPCTRACCLEKILTVCKALDLQVKVRSQTIALVERNQADRWTKCFAEGTVDHSTIS
ncbi:hypothetical protein ACLOJK_014578 [Asimina triloba]